MTEDQAPDSASGQASGEEKAAEIAHFLAKPDSIRQRAQNSAAIAGGAAAVLAAFGTVSGRAHDLMPLIAVATGLVAWLVSMAIYISAIAYSGRGTEKPTSFDVYLDENHEEAVALRCRVRWGRNVTWFAIFVTTLAVGLVVAWPRIEGKQWVRVALNQRATAAIAARCDWGPSKVGVVAAIRAVDLAQPVVSLRLEAGACRCPRVTVRVRKASILATSSVTETEKADLTRQYDRRCGAA